jgi:gluconate kinase
MAHQARLRILEEKTGGSVVNKMCRMFGFQCTDGDHEEKVEQKMAHGKSLDYDEQKKYIGMLEAKLRKCEKQLGEVA